MDFVRIQSMMGIMLLGSMACLYGQDNDITQAKNNLINIMVKSDGKTLHKAVELFTTTFAKNPEYGTVLTQLEKAIEDQLVSNTNKELYYMGSASDREGLAAPILLSLVAMGVSCIDKSGDSYRFNHRNSPIVFGLFAGLAGAHIAYALKACVYNPYMVSQLHAQKEHLIKVGKTIRREMQVS